MRRIIINKGTTFNIIYIVIFIGFAFWILAVKNGFMLRWYDEMSYFDQCEYSYRQYMHYPGGIFRFAGTFLTQLLYYPILGSAVLILVWLLCAWLTKISFKLSESTFPLCFLVPFCLMASVLHFDDAIITFESQGYVFYNSLGFLFSIGAYSIFHSLHRMPYAQYVTTVIFTLLYPIAGFFAMLPAIMAMINICISIRNGGKIVKLAAVCVTLLLLVVTPLCYYRYFNGTTVDNDYLYLKGLPELTTESFDWYLWTPFAAASIILILFTTFFSFIDSVKIMASKWVMWISVFLFATGILWCVRADSRKSEQFRATILMLNAIESHDWKKINHIMSLTRESANYTMCVLENLANAYLGNTRRNLDNMVTDNKDLRHDEDFNVSAYVGVPVNHYIGRFNQSYRWATEFNVEYGFRVYFLKYVVRNAIMNGDMAIAAKFNRLLLSTMFHRQWAENMQRIIDDPSLISTLPDYEFQMLLRSEEIARGE